MALPVFYFIGLAIFGIPSSINAQTIIQTTLQDDRYACSNAEVIFTCQTVGSADIVWRSTDYIGSGGVQIVFIGAASDPPDTLGSPTYPSTVATLTSETGSGETLILESTLRIRTSLLSSNSSVTCTSTTNNLMDTVSFTVLPDPERPSRMISDQTKDAVGNCILHLSWSAPTNIDSNDLSHYMLHIDGMNAANKTHTINAPWQLYAYLVCTCYNHTVSVQAVSRCGRVGANASIDSVEYRNLSSQACAIEPPESTTVHVAVTATPDGCTCSCACPPDLLWLVIILALLCLLFILATFIILCMWHPWNLPKPMDKKPRSTDQELNIVSTNAKELESESKSN